MAAADRLENKSLLPIYFHFHNFSPSLFDEFVKSPKMSHCERSEAISSFLTHRFHEFASPSASGRHRAYNRPIPPSFYSPFPFRGHRFSARDRAVVNFIVSSSALRKRELRSLAMLQVIL